MAALTLSQDDFLALGRQLADAAIAAYGQAVTAHAATLGVPAPTAHPTIMAIVNQYGGQYAVVLNAALDARLSLVESLAGLPARCAALETALGIAPAQGETLAQRIAAIEAAASTKFA